MQKAKTRAEILFGASYLKIVEIQRLLVCSRTEAKRIHDLALQYDKEKDGKWIVNPVNPKKETVLMIANTTFKYLKDQVLLEEQIKKMRTLLHSNPQTQGDQ